MLGHAIVDGGAGSSVRWNGPAPVYSKRKRLLARSARQACRGFLFLGVSKIRLSRYRTQMTDKSESDLAMAARHVAEGRRIVTQQRERIARLKADGHPTADHEQTLRVLESTLQILEDHERQIAERHARGLV
jgi:hypothetical protein